MIHSVGTHSSDQPSAPDREIDARVARANPLPDVSRQSPAHDGAMASLRDAIIATPLPKPRRWWRTKKARFIVGAAVVGMAGAGWGWSAHTGTFGQPGLTENDASEFLNGDSPDILHWVNLYTAKYTLPPGGSWHGLRSTWPKPSGWGVIQVTGIEGEVSFDAYCQWRMYWITGYGGHDGAKMAAAQTVLDQFPDWPITQKTSDPSSAIPMWRTVASLARMGNVVEFKSLYRGQCGGADMAP